MAVPTSSKPSAPKSNHKLLVFSSDSEASLQEDAAKIQTQIESHPESLSDIAFTLSQKADHGAHRAFAVTDGSSPLKISPVVESGSKPLVNFVFTGLGAQWPRMAADLFENSESFRKDVRVMDKALQTVPHPPLWTIEDEILRPPSTSRVNKAEFSTPICCALQIGLVNIFLSCGVKPEAVVGHSSGEISAAYAVGAISMSEAIRVAYYYGRAAEGLPQGAMAAVGMNAEVTKPYLDGLEHVDIGCFNSPNNVTISGAASEVDMVIERIKKDKPDVVARRLRVDRGYHHVGDADKASWQFEHTLRRGLIKPSSKLTAPFYSAVHKQSKTNDGGSLGPSYWRQNFESPVLFSNAIENMLKVGHGRNLLIEIGPHSALEKPVTEIFKEIGKDGSSTYVSNLTRNSDGIACLLSTLGRLFQEHVEVDVGATILVGQVVAAV